MPLSQCPCHSSSLSHHRPSWPTTQCGSVVIYMDLLCFLCVYLCVCCFCVLLRQARWLASRERANHLALTVCCQKNILFWSFLCILFPAWYLCLSIDLTASISNVYIFPLYVKIGCHPLCLILILRFASVFVDMVTLFPHR